MTAPTAAEIARAVQALTVLREEAWRGVTVEPRADKDAPSSLCVDARSGRARAAAMCPRYGIEAWRKEATALAAVWELSSTILAALREREQAVAELVAAHAEIVRLSGVTHFDASAEEAAKWRECADALARALCREDIYSGLSPREFVRTRVSGITLGPETDAALARYEALRKEYGA